jgi:hypothetical protein
LQRPEANVTIQRSFLSSPLVHVLTLGLLAGLVVLVAQGPPTTREEARRVVVTRTDLAHMNVGFQRTWNREPTREELRGELESFLREEILYREALARGYDEDDVVVRRAMQRKMELLGESQAASEPPTDEEIRAYFALRQEKYRKPARLSFTQIFFNPDRRENAARDARTALEALQRENPDLDSLGDRLMLPSTYADETETAVARTFGEDFAEAVVALPTGSWEGPVESGYGLHLVRVSARLDSGVPALAEVRAQVIADMEYEARNAAKEQMFQEIAQQYRIVFDSDVKALMEAESK